MKGEKWIIVSNRLPVSYDESSDQLKPSSGGLVAAINGIHSNNERVWVGCAPSQLGQTKWKKLSQEVEDKAPHSLHPIFIDPELYDYYYNKFSNDVLWPLLHYETEKVTYKELAWEKYVEVNERFAETLASLVSEGDLVWIHDFHLFLLPKMLRERVPNVRIGFFLHVPFPSSEVFRQLARRKEILKGVMESDLIGFHDYSYLRHFGSALLRILGTDSTLKGASYKGRYVKLGVFPVSIDSKKWFDRGQSDKVKKWMKQYRSKTFTFLGVDRLDYTKGLDLKLEAFRRLLEKHKEVHGRVQLIQLAVPSRQDVPDYINLKKRVDRWVGEINGAFGTPLWTPVKYIFNSIPVEQLAALYRTSDALLVTSKRDGMNLVALEYIMAQDSSNPGVLLLSEFAGAMSMIGRALPINPWDMESTADKMWQSFNMGREERAERWRSMSSFLHNYTSTDWAESFMKQLARRPEYDITPATTISSGGRDVSEFIGMLEQRGAERLVLFVDYDGCLVPIMERPEMAVLSDGIRDDLEVIKAHADIEMVIVSGRPAPFMKHQFGQEDFYLAAEHGAKVLNPENGRWKTRVRSQKKEWYGAAVQIMEDYTRRVQDSFVEKKVYSIAWHYRKSPKEYASYQARKLQEELESGLANLPIAVLQGKKVIEVRAIEANKGFFLSDFIGGLDDKTIAIALGDDRTDEDMFEVLNDRGVSIKVGRSETKADYIIENQKDVIPFLKALADGWGDKPVAAKSVRSQHRPESDSQARHDRR